jgi:hypothetical protein
MKRMYQTEWQGIQFTDFTKLSTTELAGAEFYNAFYRELFRRYSGYDELDVNWRRKKGELADWIAKRTPTGSRILSVGCGLGYMERCLHRAHGQNIELHVQDYASNASNWLRHELPDERTHLVEGWGKGKSGLFDLIYMSAVDYAIPQDEMISLLSDQKAQLRVGGACLMISASFLEECPSAIQKIKDGGEDIGKRILEAFGLYRRGQFWGWQRTESEYQELMTKAGYIDVADGFIQTPNQRTYFIEGRKSPE